MSEATPPPPAAPQENPGTEATRADGLSAPRKSFWEHPRFAGLIISGAVLLFLECAGLPLLSLLVGMTGILTLGWAWFLYQTLPQVSVSQGDVTLGAMVLGLLLCGGHLLAGWFARQRKKAAPSYGTSACCVLLVVLMFAAGTAMVAGVHQLAWLATSEEPLFSRGFARRSQSRHHLKQIGLAMHLLHDQEQQFPPGGSVDEWGTPQHSWVTQLLPYLDHARLYDQIDLRRPWSDERNRAALQQNLYTMQNSGIRDGEPLPDGLAPSHYAANARVCGLGRAMRIQEMTDGTSTTILAGEISTEIPAWGDPSNFRDPARGINGEPRAFGSPWRSGTQVVLSDGRAVLLNYEIDPRVLKALSTPNEGDQRILEQWQEQF